jgi:hypothetical protein
MGLSLICNFISLLQWRENIDDFKHMIDQLFGEATFETDCMVRGMYHTFLSGWVGG